MIRFGNWSTTLALGMGFGLVIALLLASTRGRSMANRLLAGLLVVISLKLAPYMLGFAGFYEAYPWLSFAPFSFGLAFGPLLYFYVHQLTTGQLPARAGRHLIPAAIQASYYLLIFPLPLGIKDEIALRLDGPIVQPIETWLELASMAVYLVAARRQERRYQSWLDQTFSNREAFRLPWLHHFLWVLQLVLPLWAGFELLGMLADFDYYQRYPLYLGLTVLVAYLGLEGWRHADLVYPLPASPGPAEAVPDPVPEAPEPALARDWAQLGQRWRQELAEAGWWRDPELSLARLARHLGTNTHYLSRAFNEGLGESFNAVVNGLRVRAIADALSQDEPPADLLGAALAAGFNSKTSFNRVFKAHTGLTPSQFRENRAGRRAKT
jgi:AraC-like DNA-binding protein